MLSLLFGFKATLAICNFLEEGYGSDLPTPLQYIVLFFIYCLIYMISTPLAVLGTILKFLGYDEPESDT